ncbi:MAG TPA: enoyl-CoA hydratase-related protein, partial [Nitrospiria bacterium]|nr:enoyl-CoA hydratase-related protein [Nitrospiria bacterium]
VKTLKIISKMMDNLSTDPEVKVIIISGTGKMFSAGADVKEISLLKDRKNGMRYSSFGQGVMNRIESVGKPVIAAMNGMFCLGGGLELALAAHFRIAGDKLRLGLPEVVLGLIPGFGGTQRLARLLGTARALELILTGDRIPAKRAYEIGLVNMVVPEGEVLKRSRSLAKKLSGFSQIALRNALYAVTEGRSLALGAGLEMESRLFGSLCETYDKTEGLTAFFEKRDPQFKGR